MKCCLNFCNKIRLIILIKAIEYLSLNVYNIEHICSPVHPPCSINFFGEQMLKNLNRLHICTGCSGLSLTANPGRHIVTGLSFIAPAFLLCRKGLSFERVARISLWNKSLSAFVNSMFLFYQYHYVPSPVCTFGNGWYLLCLF